MLSFKVHQLQLGGRHYLLLPKMNVVQVQVIVKRLASLGYSSSLSGRRTSRSANGTIHIDPSGVCWSMSDPADAILPAVPEILEAPKEPAPLRELKSKYVKLGSSGARATARISTRVEFHSLWDKLRGSDECALAPDEHAVASFLMQRAKAGCGLITDFPTDETAMELCGGKRYFDSKLDSAQATRTLRLAGVKGSRNAYLHRDELLQLEGFAEPPRNDWMRLFDELGEWCGFVPSHH